MTTLAYIGGIGRSGSTLLSQMLSGLDDVCALGEVIHLWERGVRRDELCACGQPFSRCPFWRDVGDLAFGGWRVEDANEVGRIRAAADRNRQVPRMWSGMVGPRVSSAASELVERLVAVYTAAAAVNGASIVVDSSKHPAVAYALRRQPGLDLRVVHLVRDSRGVAYSWAKTVSRPEAGADSDLSTMEQYAPWRSAMLWNVQNLAMTALGATETPVQRMRYEDLVDDPLRTTVVVATFIGAKANRVGMNVDGDSVTVPVSHQVSGNPIRLSAGAVTLRRDDAWRAKMSPTHRRLVTGLTVPLLRVYGYV
jgi:hypothetical protein